ncbi:uncharacterized protein Z520_04107 [Fonsecaea multimorphosa CBS 102226]|uniref:Transcription factor domain-containing protein n=1 Tax=Fonsecaea multimorphosa CBS 102226 TaxID=1442371 RepID=A0A0D2ITZ4_9EURO|nr:uncharacterized protein Z520_04107 [Fonsecaea multimorphosa CBS 102226]KIY00422.1 hypothetical protein Z520_04107 [Fonsecaea multimorphosa CBS 102226]OAL26937.1 hypothetical protein AYO22_03881 [Fonsecaea multimorphosa]
MSMAATAEPQLPCSSPEKLPDGYALADPSRLPEIPWTWGIVESLENCLPISELNSDGNDHFYHALQANEELSSASRSRFVDDTDAVDPTALNNMPRSETPQMSDLPTATEEGFIPQIRRQSPKKSRVSQMHRYDGRGAHSYVSSYLKQTANSHPTSNSAPSVSEFQAQEQLNNTVTKSLITDVLFRIYRDSIESALTCWLTERTCPYNIELQPRLNQRPLQDGRDGVGGVSLATFYARVCRLDQSSSKWLTRRLTPTEDATASRVLKTAIMAFASQWSHLGSSRQRSCFDYLLSDDGYFNESTSLDEGALPQDVEASDPTFDRSFQEMLWDKARSELQNAWELDSFRVAFAQLIFSVTQRHLDPTRHRDELKKAARRRGPQKSSCVDYFSPYGDSAAPGSTDFTPDDDCATLGARLAELDALGGPPVYLETALRQLLHWRRKIQRMDQKQQIPANTSTSRSASASVSPVDRKTFDMLFWLGVICDTLSAASSNRPLVISDEDSAIIERPLPQSHLAEAHNVAQGVDPGIHGQNTLRVSNKRNQGLWGAYFLDQDWPRDARSSLRWPCAFNEASAALCEANPIKVLLYRKVASLQALSLRAVPPERVEKCIQEALRVYQHWNGTYGRFIIDCLDHYGDLPPSLQSWCVVLAGHWYLGTLLLADAIDAVDEDHQGGREERALRKSTPLTLGLRKDNVDAITELARVTCNSEPQLTRWPSESLHYFEGMALLSEPWTALLIQCFTKALELITEWLMACGRQNPNDKYAMEDLDPVSLQDQFDVCVQALKMLGKKSDVANLAAMTISLEFPK